MLLALLRERIHVFEVGYSPGMARKLEQAQAQGLARERPLPFVHVLLFSLLRKAVRHQSHQGHWHMLLMIMLLRRRIMC